MQPSADILCHKFYGRELANSYRQLASDAEPSGNPTAPGITRVQRHAGSDANPAD